MASRVTGADKVSKKLRKISEYAGKPVKAVLQQSCELLVSDIKANTPSSPIREPLRETIEYKLTPDGLTGVVGPGVKTSKVIKATSGGTVNLKKIDLEHTGKKGKRILFQGIKAGWIEYGTKGYSVKNRVKKGLYSQKKGVFFGKDVTIPARAARPFINPAYEAREPEIKPKIAAAFSKMMEEVSRGDG